VRVQGPLYIPNSSSGKEDLHVTTISSTSLLFGPHIESLTPTNGYGPGMSYTYSPYTYHMFVT
jgi:hypothetical protein